MSNITVIQQITRHRTFRTRFEIGTYVLYFATVLLISLRDTSGNLLSVEPIVLLSASGFMIWAMVGLRIDYKHANQNSGL